MTFPHYHIPLKNILALFGHDLSGISTAQAAEMLDISLRQVNYLARKHGWQIVGQLGAMNVYAEDNVKAYQDSLTQAEESSGYSTTEIMERFGVTRGRVSALAKRLGWPVVEVGGQTGRLKYYDKAAVDEYAARRDNDPPKR